MPGPWENYQSQAPEQGPWTKYAAVPPTAPAQAAPAEKPGFLSTLGSDLKGMIAMPRGLNPYPGMGMEDKAAATEQSSQNDESRKAAGYGLPYRAIAPVAESVGVNVPGMEKDAREGNEAGVMGHAIAGAVPAVTPLAVEGAFRGVRAAAPPMIRGAAKTANVVLSKAPGAAGAAIGGSLGHASGVPGMGTVGGIAGYAAGEAMPKLRLPGENFGRPKPVFPGAPLPEAAPGLIQARPIGQGGGSIAPPPSAALGKIRTPEAAPEAPTIAKPNTSPKAVQAQINDSLGGRPLQPGVKLRDQGKIAAPSAAPVGMKPVESGALKSYSYDPAKREFTAVTNAGATHITGDVSPEQVAKFEAATSKGKAWNELRQNGTPVGKIVNGQRVNTIPPKALHSASPEDLTPQLEESVRRAKASRASR